MNEHRHYDHVDICGQTGAYYTIEIAEVVTGEPGSQAQVINLGTKLAAKLKFIIPRGDSGSDGASAYIVARGQGFTGTVEEWLESLVGAVFTPSLDDAGNLSWTNNRDLPNPKTKNIRGPQGIQGVQGPTGLGVQGIEPVSGDHAPGTYDVYRMVFTDGSSVDFEVYNGANGDGAAIVRNITIPAAGWQAMEEKEEGFEDYNYVAEVAIAGASEAFFPVLALAVPSMKTASNAGLCPTVETFDGGIRLWTESVPAAELTGTIMLRMDGGTGTGIGGSADIATDEEVSDTIDDVFGGESSGESGDIETDEGNTDSSQDIATDKEVNDTIDDIFGLETVNE